MNFEKKEDEKEEEKEEKTTWIDFKRILFITLHIMNTNMKMMIRMAMMVIVWKKQSEIKN